MDTPRRKRGRPPGLRSGPSARTATMLELLKEYPPSAVARAMGVSTQAVCQARDYWAGWVAPPLPTVSVAA